MSRKTSVYLSDEIAAGLEELSLNVPQALRIAINAERARREAEQPATPEMQLLTAVARNIVRIRDAVVCDCLGDRKGHLAGSTPACSGGTSDASHRRQIGSQLAANSLGADSTKRPSAKQEMLAHVPGRWCAQCGHRDHPGACAGQCESCARERRLEAVQQTPHQRGLLTGTMTPDEVAGLSEPVEFYPVAEKAEIHAAHCCKIHGCKYSPDNKTCPVFTGKIEQLYLCEWCSDEASEIHEVPERTIDHGAPEWALRDEEANRESDDEVLQLADEILADHRAPVNGNMRGPAKCTSCGEIHPCRVRQQAAAAKARILVKRQNEENGDPVNG